MAVFGVTQRNLQVLRALRDLERATAFPVTVRDVCGHLGMSPATVQGHIDRLAAAGLVERRGKRRVVTLQGLSALNGLLE